MEQLYDCLQSLWATGLGFWNVILFFQYRKLKKAQAIADTRDVWQEIAESNNKALLQQNEEIRKLREAVNTFERIMLRFNACHYYDICPVRSELQKFRKDKANESDGQSASISENNSCTGKNPFKSSET